MSVNDEPQVSELQQPDLGPVQRLQLRAAIDSDYRAAVLADPRAALAELGFEVPESISIDVQSSTATTFVLALPPVVDGELGDEELAEATGGAKGELEFHWDNLKWCSRQPFPEMWFTGYLGIHMIRAGI
jgi:hypothetical protein